MATFPWDAPVEPEVPAPVPAPPVGSGGVSYPNVGGPQLPGNPNNDPMGIMRSGGLNNNNSHIASGGLVLPGGGQIAQSDGAVDEKEEIKLTPREIDAIIADNIARGTVPNADGLNQGVELELDIPPHILRRLQLQQTDGADDSDDINSDLDDSEEDQDSYNEDEDLENGMIMLCLYDKVQRVKNKWKYVLKDGIANINGKDYVFAKATGESEW